MAAHGNNAESTDNIKSLESLQIYFIFEASGAPDVNATRWFSVRAFCLPKATALRQETRTVCENQMISDSSRRLAENLHRTHTDAGR